MNHITHLVDAYEDRVKKYNDMCDIIRSYFTKVFAGEIEEVVGAHITSLRSTTVEQNVKLVEEASFEEFTIAIKKMYPDKISGPKV